MGDTDAIKGTADDVIYNLGGMKVLSIATLIGIDVKVIVKLWANYRLKYHNNDCKVLSCV